MNTSRNKTILITGCATGIGYCVAKNLQQRGYQVFATVRQAKDVKKLQQQGLNSLVLDLADSSSIQTALKTVLEQTQGQLYAVFNNGAYGQPGAIEDLSREVLTAQFEANVFGTHELTNSVIPIMRQQGYGRIIQHSSVLGLVSLPYRGAYNASKHALEGLSDTLRLELMGSGIFVSLIEPGPILTQFRANSFRYYQQNIDAKNSYHRHTYEKMEARLTKTGAAVPFTLPPEAVLKKVIHALESRHPKVRYYVTFPTYFLTFLDDILPDKLMDKVLLKISSA